MQHKVRIVIWQYFILAAGLCLTSACSWIIYQGEVRDTKRELNADIEHRAEALSRVLRSNIEPLHNVATLFSYQDVPSYSRFRQHVQGIMSRHSAITAIEWAPRVLSSERNEYELLMQDKIANFEFTQRDLNRKIVTAGLRDEYFPVYYVAPYELNKKAHGFDLASSPIRLDSIRNARASGKKIATASINLVQTELSDKGFLVFLPIYRASTPRQSLDNLAKDKQFIGFVIGAYSINELFLQSEMFEQHHGLDLKLFDNTADGMPELILHHHSHVDQILDDSLSYQSALPDLYSRSWSIVGVPSESYVANFHSLVPYSVALLGTILTLLMLFYVRSIASKTAHIQHFVEEKTKELSLANQKLKRISRTDSLTKLSNRRCMDIFFDKEWSRALRHKSFLSVIMIDIDNFKQYNDYYGHQMGDDCLARVAKALAGSVGRPGDMVARYGGEEFCVIIAHTDDVSVVAHRCQSLVERLAIPHQLSAVSEFVTVSVGYSSVVPTNDMQSRDVFKAADKALYLAKNNGKNRVEKEVVRVLKALATS